MEIATFRVRCVLSGKGRGIESRSYAPSVLPGPHAYRGSASIFALAMSKSDTLEEPSVDAAPADGLLPVGTPVRVTRAGEWLGDWAEILKVHTPAGEASPVHTYDVLVKPMTDVTTVSDNRGPSVTDGNGRIFQLHSVWYVITDKPYPAEVVELQPEADPDAAEMIEAYRRQYESDAFYRGLVADEKRRRSNVTVRVLLNSDARELSAIGPTRGFDEVAVSVDVNLYWMDEVLKAMKKYKPTIPSNVRGLRKNAVVFFFHTEKSRMAMKKNFHEVLVPAIREGLLAANGDDARASAGSSVAKRGGGTLYLDGHELAEDPETCGFAGHCYEYQHVLCWAIDRGVPLVFVPAGERYDRSAWQEVRHGRRDLESTGCGCVTM